MTILLPTTVVKKLVPLGVLIGSLYDCGALNILIKRFKRKDIPQKSPFVVVCPTNNLLDQFSSLNEMGMFTWIWWRFEELLLSSTHRNEQCKKFLFSKMNRLQNKTIFFQTGLVEKILP